MLFRFKFITSFFIAALILPILCGSSRAHEWGPWKDAPISPHHYETEFHTSLPTIAGLSLIRFYQAYISPALREEKCNFTPSCSNYGYQSIEKYGPVLGVIMTFERNQRCHAWARAEGYSVRGRRLIDEPEGNVFF